MKIDREYPRLFNCFGSRLHNFWPEMYGNWENALMDYMSSKTVETLQQIRKELKSIISAGHDEGTLRKIVTRDLGANFYAPGDGTTYQVWLEKVYEMAGDWIKKKVEH